MDTDILRYIPAMFLDPKTIVEIAILWFIIYKTIVFLKDTTAVYAIRAIIVLTIFFFLCQRFGLTTINWIMTKMFTISVVALLIIFQQELRQGLVQIGRRSFFQSGYKSEEAELVIREIAAAAALMAKKKIGALIALQREMSLKNFVDSGSAIDAQVSSELLQAIFNEDSPIHDGGIVVVAGRLAAAGCLFPLSDNPEIDKALGMRHRAGIGISEETDAVVVLVSEETGTISIALNGRLTKNLTKEELTTILKGLLKKKSKR
jgi:diadenylate cyclase